MNSPGRRLLNVFQSFHRLFLYCGIDPVGLLRLRHLGKFLSDWRKYQRSNPEPAFRIELESLFPILGDFHSNAGEVLDDYFHQDLWAARKIYRARPARHVDIGSRIDGFIAHLLVFMPVEYVDIRPLLHPVKDLTVIQSDATSLSMYSDNSIPSLSSLHVAEHFGLGRYSDPIDPTACFAFMSSLARVLAPGGRLYFSAPMGRERVEFNAHRVFALQTVLSRFSALKLLSFSFVDDSGRLHEKADTQDFPHQSQYACGLFEFTKE